MATRKDVARLADVSEATVSRVFNNQGPIREQTRMAVMKAANELQYTPNALAQNFVRGRSGNLGVMLPLLPKVHLFSKYYFAEILSGIGQAANERGYDLLLMFASAQHNMDYLRMFHARKVDALIMLGQRDIPENRAPLTALVEHKLPICVVGQRFTNLEVDTVDADHVTGSYEMVRHLIKIGRRRIAFMNGPLEYSNSEDRLAGYKAALADNGIAYDASLVFKGNFSRKSGYELASRIASIRTDLDAVFASNDRMAVGLLQGLNELGITYGQLPIVGYDNSDIAQFSNPPLTTVEVPLFEMGQLATHKLLDRLGGSLPEEPFQEKLSTRLVVRSTSKC
jgi:LacI family transcriptional regulator